MLPEGKYGIISQWSERSERSPHLAKSQSCEDCKMDTPSIPNPTNTTTSHVYLALGKWRRRPLMKFGKANNLEGRQKGLTLRIEYACVCDSEKAAFALENEMRWLMHRLGARRYGHSNDWFYFDSDIYAACHAEFAKCAPGGELIHIENEIDPDELDIESLQLKYKEIKRGEEIREIVGNVPPFQAPPKDARETALEEKIKEAQSEVKRLQDELARLKVENRLRRNGVPVMTPQEYRKVGGS